MKQRCRETLERVYLFLDGEGLTEAERIEIETHLEECGPCFERYGLETEVKVIVARLRDTHRCPDALRSRIAALLQQD
ncbi:MAG: mycothiol system anti-sigma-R factor [Actinomycetota bacterium]